MSKLDIDKLLIKVLNKLEKDDKVLLENDLHETTIVFRFAHYLANIIEKKTEYKVDAEYNRDRNKVKKVDNENKRPDLIIHKRNSNDNLVAIEFKKKNDSTLDKKKLEKFMKLYSYKYVYFIQFKLNKIESYNGDNWINIEGENYE